MRPSGEVVRRITLTGKSTFGAGLQVGADGSLYVSDQAGGAIRYYSLMLRSEGDRLELLERREGPL